MEIKPLNTLFLVKYIEEKEKQTEAGVYIPKTAENNAIGFLRMGEVIEINRKEADEEQDIAVGDKIYFNKNAICYIPEEKEKIFVRKEDIYGVVRE